MIHPFNKYFDKVLILTTTHQSCSDRIERIKKRMIGIDYEFFYGEHAADMDIDSYRKQGVELTDGQISCAANHLKMYQYILDNNFDNCLILEDDAVISKSEEEIDSCISNLPDDWKLFYLGYIVYQQFQSNYAKNLHRFSSKNYVVLDCTYGFSITRDIAKFLLESNLDLSRTADGSIQRMILNQDLDVYAATPALIDHEGKESILALIDSGYFKK